MLHGWEISLFIALAGVIGTFAVMKNKVNEGGTKDKEQDTRLKELEKFMNEKAPLLEHLSKVENAFGKKLDEHAGAIVAVKEKITQAPTMKEVRDEFVTKEMFKQMEKHIDEKFDRVEMGLSKILEKLEKE